MPSQSEHFKTLIFSWGFISDPALH